MVSYDNVYNGMDDMESIMRNGSNRDSDKWQLE